MAKPPLPKALPNGNYPAVEYARKSLARKIIKARKAAGLHQWQLGKQAGVSESTIARIEQGKRVSAATIKEVLRALDYAPKKA